MPYKLACNTPSNIVTVTYTGKVDLDTRLRAVDDLCRDYGHLKPFRILVDVQNMEMGMLLSEQEAFGEYLANHHELRQAKVALVHEKSFNPNSVIDISAYNNGYYLGEFSDPHEAEQWLLQVEPE